MARFVAVGVFGFALFIFVSAGLGRSNVFSDFVAWLPYGDKLGHVGLIGALTFVAIEATGRMAWRWPGLYVGAVGVAALMLFEELTQLVIPQRTFDPLDLAANTIGILIASLVVLLISRTSTSPALPFGTPDGDRYPY